MPRRFLAPNANEAVLAEPGFDAIPGLVDANRRVFDRDDVQICGVSLREFRDRARREVWEAASGLPTTESGSRPLLIAGHQPELSHPGVWVKNFALSGLAKKVGGIALNLIVDNDTLKNPFLRLPAFQDRSPDSVRLDSVKFDRPDDSPYESRPVVDATMFRSFPQRAAELWKNWGFEPLLPSVWRDGKIVGEVFTRMRIAKEREWGCENLELPVSRLAQTASFGRFARHILDDLPHFREVYNSAIRAYRKANRIRSANHPAPELEPHEAPFWSTEAGGRRRPATAHSTNSLRPRALTLTLFARLCLGDFFVHGIGGGKYDEVTDAIIRDYFGVEPPSYQVLSATLHLPLPGFDSTEGDVKWARRFVRDLNWNPQRHVLPPALHDAHVLRMVADRIQATNEEPSPSDRAARRNWFRRIQELNEKLRPLASKQLPSAKAELLRTEAESRANAILERRDYSWVLFPEATLRPFLQRFL